MPYVVPAQVVTAASWETEEKRRKNVLTPKVRICNVKRTSWEECHDGNRKTKWIHWRTLKVTDRDPYV